VYQPPEPPGEPEESLADRPPQLHVAEYFTVGSLGQALGFMRRSMSVYTAARAAEGFVTGGIRAKWWAKKFWSYLIWDNRESMERFTKSFPVEAEIESLHRAAGPGSCYVEWTSDMPPDWPEAIDRLERPTRYYVPPL